MYFYAQGAGWMPDPEAAREGGGQERDSAAGAALPKYHSGRRRPITALASTLSKSHRFTSRIEENYFFFPQQ